MKELEKLISHAHSKLDDFVDQKLVSILPLKIEHTEKVFQDYFNDNKPFHEIPANDKDYSGIKKENIYQTLFIIQSIRDLIEDENLDKVYVCLKDGRLSEAISDLDKVPSS